MRLSTDLDAKDIDILTCLQDNGRASLGSIAERVGLSSPAVAERLRKMEDRGVVAGFSAAISPEPLALDIAAIIHVRVDSSTHYAKFLSKVSASEEVLECHAITGEASHIMKVRTKNTSTLERLLAEIQRWPGVIGTRTSLVLSTHKETSALPLTYAREIVGETRGGRDKQK